MHKHNGVHIINAGENPPEKVKKLCTLNAPLTNWYVLLGAMGTQDERRYGRNRYVFTIRFISALIVYYAI